jgi:hypothetical protein
MISCPYDNVTKLVSPTPHKLFLATPETRKQQTDQMFEMDAEWTDSLSDSSEFFDGFSSACDELKQIVTKFKPIKL